MQKVKIGSNSKYFYKNTHLDISKVLRKYKSPATTRLLYMKISARPP